MFDRKLGDVAGRVLACSVSGEAGTYSVCAVVGLEDDPDTEFAPVGAAQAVIVAAANRVLELGMNSFDSLRLLPDDDLVRALDDLAVRDRQTGAAIMMHLVVVAERSLHLDLGYGSLVEYCTDRLGCSTDVAYKRAAATKVAARHPEVLDWLADGTMSLSGLAQLAPHRDDLELVQKARGRSKREIQRLAAARHPDPNWSRVQSRVRPVAEGLSRLEITVPDGLLDKIQEALDLDSHLDPARNVADMLGRALELYLGQRKRRRFAATERPRPAASRVTRRVPAANLRVAYQASGGQCQYVAPDGRRCGARAFLEIDHIIPRAQGGGHDQLRVYCRAHNQRAAELAFGEDHMARARRTSALRRDVTSGLVNLGYPARVASRAAGAALQTADPHADLVPLLQEAIRRASSFT